MPGSGNALLAFEHLVGINKHRFIYVALVGLDNIRLKMTWKGLKPITANAKHLPGELKDGAELITFHLTAAQMRAQFQVEASLATEIAVAPTDLGWINLKEFGGKIGAYVEHVVGQLEGFLTPGHRAPPSGTRFPLNLW